MIARLLDRETVSFIALDTDASHRGRAAQVGLPVYTATPRASRCCAGRTPIARRRWC